MQKPEFWFIGL